MASRRMFSKEFIESDYFLDLPLTTQALYFHLCLNADDDGFIKNAKSITKLIGVNLSEIQMLINCNFLIPIDNTLLVVTHWNINNQIRKDRKKDTIHQEQLKKIYLTDDSIYVKKEHKEINNKVLTNAYGNFNNVYLTDDEYKQLIDRVGNSKAVELIERVSNYLKQTDKKYTNHLAVIYYFNNNDKNNIKNDNSKNYNIDYENINFESL